MQHVITAARNIGCRMVESKTIVDKSTVPVGTADRVRETIAIELARRGVELSFAVASNPEFLKEGAAVEDFMRPDRVVIGSDDERAIGLLRAVYAPFQRNHERMLVMDVRSAELTKYAANAMLATRISFMNELANLADALGADIEHVRRGIGSDPRIGYRFLYPGAGYGGSCFPKDVKALQATAGHYGRPLKILAAVEAVNDAQKELLLEKITQRLGPDLANKTFAVWGLAFKANTDDMREAPSQTLVRGLLDRGASVMAYDPVAMEEARRVFGTTARLGYAASPMDAVAGADAVVVVTEWQEFRSPDFSELKRTLRQPLLFDGRNLFDPKEVRAAGLEYFGIGRP
jgi:UDPglucose 6-dehydrogenase